MDKKLTELIAKLLPVPYVHEGRDYSGLDCGGLILLFYRDYLKIRLPDMHGYNPHWGYKGKNYFIDDYYQFFIPVKIPQLSDIVLFRNNKEICDHGGVVLTGGEFLHCHRHVGVSINRYGAIPWSRRPGGFYRLKPKYQEAFRIPNGED
ncbi:MAG: NlpC/P60 family protein [Synergistaceae bacterium]|jgi:cell wall-associated NlpC family hydrolase